MAVLPEDAGQLQALLTRKYRLDADGKEGHNLCAAADVTKFSPARRSGGVVILPTDSNRFLISGGKAFSRSSSRVPMAAYELFSDQGMWLDGRKSGDLVRIRGSALSLSNIISTDYSQPNH